MTAPRMTLREAFPQNDLLTVRDCVARLGWSAAPAPDGYSTGPLTCECGAGVKVGGWVGTEHAWCPKCGKGMQDMTALLPSGAHCAGVADCEYPEDGAVWTPENVWGFK